MTETPVTDYLPSDGSPIQAKQCRALIAGGMGISLNTVDKRLADAGERGEVLRYADLDARNREAIFYALPLGRNVARAFYTPSDAGVYAGSLSADMQHWRPILVGQVGPGRCPTCGQDLPLR